MWYYARDIIASKEAHMYTIHDCKCSNTNHARAMMRMDLLQYLLKRGHMPSNLEKLAMCIQSGILVAYAPTIYKCVFNMATSVCTTKIFFFWHVCLNSCGKHNLEHCYSLKTATTGIQISTDKITAIEADITLFTLDY